LRRFGARAVVWALNRTAACSISPAIRCKPGRTRRG
jgi:hypothetical protein